MTIDDRSLVKNPRKVTLISVRDGHTKEFVDDGASITQDGVFPSGLRQHLLANLNKEHAQGSKTGPRIRSWVLAGDLERGQSNSPKTDPALAAARLDQPACDGKTYAQIIEINKKAIEARAVDEAKALATTAKGLQLDPSVSQALLELIADKAKAKAKASA